MAQILKNVWRNVLSGSSFTKTPFKATNFTTSCKLFIKFCIYQRCIILLSIKNIRLCNFLVSEVGWVRSTDTIMSTIKSAPTPENILATVQQHLPLMTHKHLLQALRSLFELQKSGKLVLQTL